MARNGLWHQIIRIRDTLRNCFEFSPKSFSCLDVFVFVCTLGDFWVLPASVLRQIPAIFLITQVKMTQNSSKNHHTINSKQFLLKQYLSINLATMNLTEGIGMPLNLINQPSISLNSNQRMVFSSSSSFKTGRRFDFSVNSSTPHAPLQSAVSIDFFSSSSAAISCSNCSNSLRSLNVMRRLPSGRSR